MPQNTGLWTEAGTERQSLGWSEGLRSSPFPRELSWPLWPPLLTLTCGTGLARAPSVSQGSACTHTCVLRHTDTKRQSWSWQETRQSWAGAGPAAHFVLIAHKTPQQRDSPFIASVLDRSLILFLYLTNWRSGIHVLRALGFLDWDSEAAWGKGRTI